MQTNTHINFIRKRTLVWVCDIEKSSNVLNDINQINEGEEFLKRFFFISSILLRVTGGTVRKWTGDGFLAAYEIPLERNLGEQASKVFSAAWHLTFLIKTTQLGIACSKRFKIRHGITYEPDAILVEQKSDQSKTMDIIGRSVVLAFRLSGIKASFPSIVTQKKIIEATTDPDRPFGFNKLNFSHDDLLKYFKGEKWSTGEIFASNGKTPREKNALSAEYHRQQAAEKTNPKKKNIKNDWLSKLYHEMAVGPRWAQKVRKSIAEPEKEELPNK